MKSLIKKVLIVDDSEHIDKVKIPIYNRIFEKLQNNNECKIDYELKFEWESKIKTSIERLNNKNEVFQVILIDYQFNNDEYNLKGVDLVKEIRRTINKRCKIIFYTMNGYEGIDKREYVELINSDIYRFLSKSGEAVEMKASEYTNYNADEIVVRSIVQAIEDEDPVTNALESFLIQYYNILKDTKIKVDNGDYTFQELIDSIRLDMNPGKIFIEKMLKMAILDFVDVLD